MSYESLFDRMKTLVESGKTLGALAAGGCCGLAPAPGSHEEILGDYIPRLNEVIFEIFSEDKLMQMGFWSHAGQQLQLMPFKTLESICQFTKKIVGSTGVEPLEVTMEGGVKGLSPEQTPQVGDLVTVKVTSRKRKGVKQDHHPCQSWFILTNSVTNIALISDFKQVNEVHSTEFQT